MKVGDTVRLIGVPDGLPNPPDLPTGTVFRRCLGHRFLIAGFNEFGMVEINVESVTGSAGETVWVEPEFLEVIST